MDTILNSVPFGFLSFTDDGIVTQANRTLLELVGRGDRGLDGQHLETIFTVASRIFYQTHFFPLLKMNGRADEIYLSLRSEDGEVPVLVNAVRQDRSGVPVYECVLVPMRRRSQYEDEILRAKRELEEANRGKDRANTELELTKDALERKQGELEERNRELETLKGHLEEQVQARTAELQTAVEDLKSFSYAIAHDLRAPLRSIVSTSEILKEEAPTALSEDHRNLLERQSINGRKLASLIDDLLRFARLGRAGIFRVDVNVSELATDVIADLSLPPRTKKPTFSVQPGMRGTGDPALVRVVLENLIQNAAKYSPEGGEIHVGSVRREGERIFFVEDHGIGFEMEFANKIFLPFERLHYGSEFPGNGIGLATVRRVIERQGGAVWAESTPGQGSRFFFTLGENADV